MQYSRNAAITMGTALRPPQTQRVASGVTTPITLQIFSDLVTVERQWREFEQTADMTVFQCFDWVSAWYRHIGHDSNTTLVIVLGSVNGKPLFLLPLAIVGTFVRRLGWLGVDLADYNGPLLAPDFRVHVPQFAPVWEQIVSLIQSNRGLRFHIVELDKMPAEIGSQANPFSDLPLLRAEYSAHCLMLPDSWEPFYRSKVSTKGREADRRKLRRLGERGQVRLVEVVEPDDIQNTLTALIKQKRASLARMGVFDLFSRPAYQEFYRTIALQSFAHVTRVDIGDDPAATGLALRFRSRYLMIIHSYQQDYAKYSPGSYHIQQLIQYTIAQQLSVIDFTIGDEPYKDNWCETVSPLLRYYNSRTILGHPITWLMKARHWAVLCYKWYKKRRSR